MIPAGYLLKSGMKAICLAYGPFTSHLTRKQADCVPAPISGNVQIKWIPADTTLSVSVTIAPSSEDS